jgi:hypothetical protein
MMHGPINVKFLNNISKWQMGFNSAFKGLTMCIWLVDEWCTVRQSVWLSMFIAGEWRIVLVILNVGAG